MSILQVVTDVCLACGLNAPTSLFAASIQPRTQAELLSLANEMAQRIADDTREWTALKTVQTYTGDGIQTAFPLPANYRRMLLSSQVRRSSSPTRPLRFIEDADLWLERRLTNMGDAWGEWILLGDQMHIWPAPGAGETVTYPYLDKNCVTLGSGGFSNTFIADNDSFRLPERVLKLGMIWQWKANKGSPYSEDMSTFGDALQMLLGADKPAPILIGRQSMPISGTVAYPWQVPTP
jgi:hypothetical protein